MLALSWDHEDGCGMGLELLGKIGDEGKVIPFLGSIPAGFPSPADDYLDKSINLHELMVEHPEATFLMRVQGESMLDAGIHDGDVLVIDRALAPSAGRVVIAQVGTEFTVKRLAYREGQCFLDAANPDFPSLEVTGDTDNQVWGVVTFVIHKIQ